MHPPYTNIRQKTEHPLTCRVPCIISVNTIQSVRQPISTKQPKSKHDARGHLRDAPRGTFVYFPHPHLAPSHLFPIFPMGKMSILPSPQPASQPATWSINRASIPSTGFVWVWLRHGRLKGLRCLGGLFSAVGPILMYMARTRLGWLGFAIWREAEAADCFFGGEITRNPEHTRPGELSPAIMLVVKGDEFQSFVQDMPASISFAPLTYHSSRRVPALHQPATCDSARDMPS